MFHRHHRAQYRVDLTSASLPAARYDPPRHQTSGSRASLWFRTLCNPIRLRRDSPEMLPIVHSSNIRSAQRVRWMRLCAVVALMITITYVLIPSGGYRYLEQHSPASEQLDSRANAVHGVEPHPTSAAEICSISHDGVKPPVQYVLMVDAGSTGSRIHVYKFNNCQRIPALIDEVFEQVKPGLSSYKTDAAGAAHSLDPLLTVALASVPREMWNCTPIAVKATAGLRLLGDGQSSAILDAVRKHLETDFPFPVVFKDGVSILDGKDEGVFAWITTNYLLGNIGGSEAKSTAAICDLGGGSTQIVFEPDLHGATQKGIAMPMHEGDHKYQLYFGGREYILYQHSHLGYGLMEARKRMYNAIKEISHANDEPPVVTSPCLPPNLSHIVKSADMFFNMTGSTVAYPLQCRHIAESILNKTAHCPLMPCSFNGIHQPSISDTFESEDIYLFSYFYDRTAPLGMPSSFIIEDLISLTEEVCHGHNDWDNFKKIPGAFDELKNNPDFCLDLSFIGAILETGYGLDRSRRVNIAKKIANKELGWCLGASIPLLNSEAGWECKMIV